MVGDTENFKLGTPALVCRWRLAGSRVPMENRHLRALLARHVNGALITAELVAWAKQHIEWTLSDGAAADPNGVLMVIVDETGKAAMSVGPYTELAASDTAALVKRAVQSRNEAKRTGVAPETLWATRAGRLLINVPKNEQLSGAATLVFDLAKVRHMSVIFGAHTTDMSNMDGLFLVSDEHGIVPALDCKDVCGTMFMNDYMRLLKATRLSR